MSSGLLTVLTPLIDQAQRELQAGLQTLGLAGSAPFPPEVAAFVPMLFEGVAEQLKQIATPTLALEINVARLRGALSGDTPEQRYESYIESLAREEVRAALAAEYPVLFQLAAERLQNWVVVSLELAERLRSDWAAVRESIFQGEDPGALASLRFTQRTTKRGGRSVVALAFESGAKLVYKPRSLAVEVRFGELLTWLNDRGFAPDFRPIPMLDCGSHGWMAWIDAAECADIAALRRFYRRQGAYLALFYALEATDIHMSNIIAAGEHPALIDLEALLHPRESPEPLPALELALDDRVYYSVLRPGLLPEPEKGDDEALEPLDLSGLAGKGGQLTPFNVPTWKGQKTDSLHLVPERKPIRGGRNLPILDGRPVDAGAYLADLEAGFADAYRLLMAHRAELLAPDGPLSAFAGAELRVLPRSGRNYGDILEASYHPDLLRNSSSRVKFLQKRLGMDASERPELARLLPYEAAILRADDVPLFINRAGSRDMMAGDGADIPDFFPHSGLEMARRRVAALDEADLDHQRWLIRASFATVAALDAPHFGGPPALPEAMPADLPRRALVAALTAGEWLARTAVVSGNEATWVGLEPDEAGHWFIEPLDDDLGYGLAGVALFLSRLGAQTGEPRWHDLAGAALNTLRRYLAEARDEADEEEDGGPIGLLFGLGGQLYALSQLTEHGHDIRDEIAYLLTQAEVALSEPDDEDEIGLAHGVAGMLTGLLAAHVAAPDSTARALAIVAGDRLLSILGTSGDTPDEPFASFYHESWGAMAPLYALAAATGQRRFRDAAARLLAALPGSAADDPGMWRAYLSARPWMSEAEREPLDAALRRALPEVAAWGGGRNHSLWYGDMGYIDLLLSAAVALDDPQLHRLAGRYAAAVLEAVDRGGWQTAAPLAVESPGFAAGLAGIGYGLLRVAAPETTPAFPALRSD